MNIGTRIKALCADGKMRSALITKHADTYFTVPARVSVRGKTVTGFIWEGSNGQTCFSADAWRRNAALLVWAE